MTSRRRQASAPRLTVGGWPPELAEPDHIAWRSDNATSQWLQSNAVERSHVEAMHGTSDERRAGAISAWAVTHHPSETWPNFVDHAWMRASGLGAIDQAATRAVWLHDLKLGRE